jgi:catecholate siderophore receptor
MTHPTKGWNRPDRTLLPIGAMLLAAAPGWAQETTAQLELPQVTITDQRLPRYQPNVTSTLRAPAAPKDVPQSLTIVNEALIKDQGRDTFRGALGNVPGITFEAGEGGRIGDSIRLRGFSVSGDIYLDGIRDIAQYNRDTFGDDRIEVLRGSASMLFGRGSTGGVVNQVSKTPRLNRGSEVDVTAGDGNYLRAAADINRKVSDTSAVRINAMTTDWDGRAGKAETHRRGLAGAWRLNIGEPDEFTAAFYHLNYHDKPDLGGRWLQGRPAPFPRDKWYGADSDYQRDSADMVTLTHTHSFADGSGLTTRFRDGHFSRDLWATQINALPAGTTLENFGPDTAVARGTQTRAGQEHHTFLQSDFTTRRQWAGLWHDWLVGADVARERSGRSGYLGVPLRPPTTVELADNTPLADTRVPNPLTQFRSTALGVFAQDTISLSGRWKLLLGLRWDRFSGTYDRSGNPAPNNTTLSRSDGVWSKRAGLMYQPDDRSNYYVSYGTSFNTSGDLYQYDNSSAKTPPESSRNVEVGAKWDLLEGDLSVRTAVARTDKFNERNTDVNQATGEYLLSGQRHTDSLEFEVSGRITPQWEVFGGIAFMNARIDKAGSSAAAQATVGMNPGLTPRRQANLWVAYSPRERWRIGGGFTGISSQGPVSANPSALANRAPGYVKWDAMVEYAVTPTQSVRVNVDNLTNRLYYAQLYQAWPTVAVGRTVRATYAVRF